MNSLFEGEFDHEYYTRIGRQSQAQTAWNLFLGLGSQIKIFFQKKTSQARNSAVKGYKC
mgnify:FL=1|jgi:hypothetical protein